MDDTTSAPAMPDFLTPDEIDRAQQLWRDLKDSRRFVEAIEREIIGPNLARINAWTGRVHEAGSLACVVDAMFHAAERRPAGYLWERIDDVCWACGRSLGRVPRFLLRGICGACHEAPRH